MVVVKEVSGKREINKFINFPVELYKNNPYYVPCFYKDEYKIFFPEKSIYSQDCKVKFFLAYKDGKVVGRIAGIIVNAFIEKTGKKVLRFSRFDFIDDAEVVQALFKAVEDFARSEGMEAIHGPMGFADTDREGLLIEGFDRMSTYAANYNYEYYVKHIENNGYGKEVDWIEYLLTIPQTPNEKLAKTAEMVAKRYELREVAVKGKSINKLIKEYGDQIFEVLDKAYAPLHGTIPIADRVKDDVLAQFKIFITTDFLSVVVDNNNQVVGFGVVFASLAKELIKNRGKLTPASIIRILNIRKNPKYVEFALIGVLPEYQGRAVNAMIMNKILQGLIDKKIEKAETNLELETNTAVLSQWNAFDKEFIKRRRCYIKTL